MTTAAIFHHPDAVEQAGSPLAGRRVAGQSFLGGLARHASGATLHCVAEKPAHIEDFRKLVAGLGWAGQVEGALEFQPERIARAGALMLPGPAIGRHAWMRRRIRQDAYSLVGITHTVATRRMMEGLFDVLTAPVEHWDAVICTSRAVRSVVAAELEAAAAYLGRRFGAARVPAPQLPVIPLGIHADRLAPDDGLRASWRTRLGLAEDEVAVISVGRLSVFEKMHPAPLMLAVERAAEACGRKVALLMTGWFDGAASEELHRAAAREFAPGIRVEFPDGRDAEIRVGIWSAADIFALPVDSIQETFGLAPVEAMAAGLPVVCSDWDGFRDTVEDGVTGIRVATLMPRPGLGETLGWRFENGVDSYRQHLGFLQQSVAVDVRALTEALATLIASPGRRRAMGAAGRRRARELYDWSVVIPQYEALWAELAARRGVGEASSPRKEGEPANPAAMDPFVLYAGYPSAVMSDETRVRTAEPLDRPRVKRLVEVTGAARLGRLIGRGEEILAVHGAVRSDGPLALGDIAARLDLPVRSVEPIVLWLAKFGLAEVER